MTSLPLFAQSLRFTARRGAPVYIPDIVNRLQERYEFVRVPSTPQEVLLPPEGPTPMLFEHGRMMLPKGGQIVINDLRVYRNGVAVSTQTSTDDSDLVLSDVLEFASAIVAPTSDERGYVNQMQVTLDV